jgi:hypothetical protein
LRSLSHALPVRAPDASTPRAVLYSLCPFARLPSIAVARLALSSIVFARLQYPVWVKGTGLCSLYCCINWWAVVVLHMRCCRRVTRVRYPIGWAQKAVADVSKSIIRHWINGVEAKDNKWSHSRIISQTKEYFVSENPSDLLCPLPESTSPVSR